MEELKNKLDMKFQNWFENKLVVNRFPLPQEIKQCEFNYIINVSDEYISYCHDAAFEKGIKYFWFPMNECKEDIGVNSIYGALQILFIAEKENKKVLLHCHAGANRSPTVADCYYFLRTKTQRKTHKSENYSNRLLMNIHQGYLPSLMRMESFLKKCEEAFQKEETNKGGYLDHCKFKSGF